MATDPCLKDCRSTFYYVTKKLNNYFIEDKGFYIEGASEGEMSITIDNMA